MGGLEPIFPNDFKYKVIDVNDVSTQDMLGHFNPTIRWIVDVINRGGNVFCHCYNGVSRSATIIVAYLMNDHALPLD